MPSEWDIGEPPFVARNLELLRLSRAYEEAQSSGELRSVTLVGSAGIGKRRLIAELVKRLSSQPAAAALRADRSTAPDVATSAAGPIPPTVYAGEPGPAPKAYGTISRLLRSRFGLYDSGDSEAARAALHRQVSEVLGDRRVGDVCYYLGEFLGLPFAESPLTRAVAGDPAQARLVRRAVVKSFLEADAVRAPLCLVLEAMHAADEDSLELIDYLLATLRGPILVLCAAQPEFLSRHAEWRDRAGPAHQLLELAPLGEDDAIQILSALLATRVREPPAKLIEAAVAMARGAPGLFAHVLRAFRESGVLVDAADEPGRWRVDLNRLASARLPQTLEEAVAARIAALAPAERRLLEHAAIMGNIFWLGGLVALARRTESAPELWTEGAESDVAEIEALLAALVARGYVLRLPDSTLSDEVEFVFQHNLEREAMARLIPTATARAYHATLAAFLEQKGAAQGHEEHAALLARQLALSGSDHEAGLAYLDLGDRARARFALKRASECYAQGLELLREHAARRRADALHAYGDTLLLCGKGDQALAAFREMLALAYRTGLRSKGGAAHNRIGRLYRETGSLAAAERHLQTALELFRRADDERGVASCHDDIGKLLWMQGEYADALSEMRRALGMRKTLGDGRSIALSLNNIGLVWHDHGRESKAREALESALKIRRELHDALGVVDSLNNLARLSLDEGNPEAALPLLDEAGKLASDLGGQGPSPALLVTRGEVHLRLGRLERAVDVLTRARRQAEEVGDRVHLAAAQYGLARAYQAQGDLRQAREAIKASVDLLGQVRSKPHLAVALRTLGEITAAGAWGEGFEGKAVDYFMRSIAIGREIDNELELAKSYRAFSTYVESSPHYQKNADIQREAKKLSAIAEDIFQRRRVAGPDKSSPVPNDGKEPS